MYKSHLLATIASIGCMTLVSPAFAQAATETAQAAETDGAIVVTAQRREQNIQDVPLAVSAVSAVTLQRQEAVSTQSLLRLFPNVSGAQISGAGANNYSIRGLSNAETAATFDTPVATYVDGIYIARINSNNFALFDVDRIEVLRGPQGTLFGRNTTGGAINIVLSQPKSEFGGGIEAEVGNYDHYQVRGSLNVPIGPKIRTRIAGYYMDEDGWAKNITTGGHNNYHKGWGVRGATAIDLSDTVTWEGSADYISDSNALLPATKVDGKWVTKSGLTKLGSLVTGLKGNIPGNVVRNKTLGLTSKFRIESTIGDIEIITGWRQLKNRYNIDYFDNPSPIGGYDSVEAGYHTQFSQEVKLSGSALNDFVDYTAGIFYFHEYNKADFTTVFRLGTGAAFIDADRTLFNSADSFAGYAQLDWHFTPQLTLTTGGRLTVDDKDIHYVNNNNPRASAQITDALLTAAGIPLAQSTTQFTPRVALQYKPNTDLMFFASATRGFKSGGWNIRAARPELLTNFGPETVWSYEGGVRSTFLGGKATANLTGFYGDTSGLQIATAVATVTGAPVFPVGNFSDFRSYGAEFEGTLRPMQGLSLFANAGWNKTKYVNPTAGVITQQAACVASIAAGAASRPNCAAGIVRADGSIAAPLRAPEWTLTGGFSYEIPLTASWMLVPSGSLRRVTSFNANSAELANTEDNGYWLASGSIGVESTDGKIRFSIGCENCNDTTYLVTVISGFRYVSPPRRWYGRIGYKF